MGPPGTLVRVDGLRMHLVDHPPRQIGTGIVGPAGSTDRPPVVLVHGMYGSSIGWSPDLIDALCHNGFRVLAVDRPGHGWSERPPVCPPDEQARLVQLACAAVGAERPIVLGHSWGAAVGLCWALDRPASATGLVCVAGYLIPSATHVPLAFKVPGMARAISPLARLAAPYLATRAVGQRPAPAHLRRSARMATGPRQLAANFEDFRILGHAMLGWLARYPQITLPVEIVAGTHDRTLSTVHHSEALHRLLPHSQLTLIPDGGHALPETHPDVIAATTVHLAENAARA